MSSGVNPLRPCRSWQQRVQHNLHAMHAVRQVTLTAAIWAGSCMRALRHKCEVHNLALLYSSLERMILEVTASFKVRRSNMARVLGNAGVSQQEQSLPCTHRSAFTTRQNRIMCRVFLCSDNMFVGNLMHILHFLALLAPCCLSPSNTCGDKVQDALAVAIHNVPPWDSVATALHTSFRVADLDLDMLAKHLDDAGSAGALSVSRGMPTVLPKGEQCLTLEGVVVSLLYGACARALPACDDGIVADPSPHDASVQDYVLQSQTRCRHGSMADMAACVACVRVVVWSVL